MSSRKSRNSLKLMACECGEDVKKVINSDNVDAESLMP